MVPNAKIAKAMCCCPVSKDTHKYCDCGCHFLFFFVLFLFLCRSCCWLIMRNCALINTRQPGVAGNRNVPHTTIRDDCNCSVYCSWHLISSRNRNSEGIKEGGATTEFSKHINQLIETVRLHCKHKHKHKHRNTNNWQQRLTNLDQSI